LKKQEFLSAKQLLHADGKRRGRKRERDDVYFVKALSKIQEIRVTLKTAKQDGLTVKQRQALRN